MRRTLRRLWADDHAAVISTELVLILAILVFGTVPGLVALRNSGIAALTELANFFSVITPRVTFSQVNTGGGGTALVVLVNPNTNGVTYTAVQVAPTVVTYAAVSPAP